MRNLLSTSSRLAAAVPLVVLALVAVSHATPWKPPANEICCDPTKFDPNVTVKWVQHSSGSNVSQFRNFDGPHQDPSWAPHVYRSTDAASRDWPITIIWSKNASRVKIQDALATTANAQGKGGLLGSSGFKRKSGHKVLEPYKAMTPDGRIVLRYGSDKGMKTYCNDWHTDIHFRTYQGKPNLRLYDPDWGGYFAISSTHLDHGENRKKNPDGDPKCIPSDEHDWWEGRSERAEKRLVDKVFDVSRAETRAGVPQTFDLSQPLKHFNAENKVGVKWTSTDKRRWESNGMATVIPVN